MVEKLDDLDNFARLGDRRRWGSNPGPSESLRRQNRTSAAGSATVFGERLWRYFFFSGRLGGPAEIRALPIGRRTRMVNHCII